MVISYKMEDNQLVKKNLKNIDLIFSH